MIEVHRLNGTKLMVNPDHIRSVESCPETLITFVDGKTILVKESMIDIKKLFLEYKQKILENSLRK